MPFDSNGNFSLAPGYLAVSGQTILPSQHNPVLEDIGSALSQALLRSGAAPMMGALNMNGFRIRNMPEGADDSDPVTYGQLQGLLAGLAIVPTGTVLGFRRQSAPSGWLKENGRTIGSASSGATNRANADTQDLFERLWVEFDNTTLTIQTSAGVASTRGASAAADFAANKRMPLFDSRSRFHRGADDGLGYDATLTVGAVQADGIKNHKHPGTTGSAGLHAHTVRNKGGPDALEDGALGGSVNQGLTTTSSAGLHAHPFTTDDNTDGLALETRPRSSVLLYCIKL